MSNYHTPVMLEEALEGLSVKPGEKYIDATLGGSGHSLEIVKRGGILLGIDADIDAIAEGKTKLGKETILIQGNFRDLAGIAKENGFEHVSGVLFDLGLSSHQIDKPERGFSYRFEHAPLDLRFDQTRGETAADLIKRISEAELAEIIARFGEEEKAEKIARAIVKARGIKLITNTDDLVEIIKNIIAGNLEQTKTLARVFQALRMYINDEIGALNQGLNGAHEILGSGGRLVVISFHSLEDRVVKQFMQGFGWKIVNKRPIVAGELELSINRRSRSAKLRIAEKI